MIKYCFLLFLVVNPVQFSQAQNYSFNTIYNYEGKKDLAYSSCETKHGDSYLVTIVSFGSGFDYAGILKLSSSGSTLDTAYYGEEGFAYYPDNIIPTIDSNYIFSGTKYKNGNGILYLTKINEALDTIWNKEYQNGIGNEGIHSIIGTSDNGVLILGYSQTFTNNDGQNFIIKTDSLGIKKWEIIYGDSTHNEEAYDAVELADSSFLVVFRRNYQQNDNIVLLKVSPQGQVIWERELNMIPGDIGTVLLPISSSTLLIGGIRWYSQTTSKGYIAKIDTSGNLLWEKEYGGNAWFSDGSKVNDNEYVFAGSIAGGITYQGKEDGYVVKVDSNGSLKWAKVINPLGLFEQNADEYFYGINALSDGGVLCTGFTFKGPFSGTQDAWILKLDSLGRCDTATCFPWLVGIENTLPPGGVQVRVFPNPASLSAVVSLSIPEPKEVKLELIDISGKRVYVLEPGFVTTGNHLFQMVTGHLPAGVYLLKITVGADMITRKLVVQ